MTNEAKWQPGQQVLLVSGLGHGKRVQTATVVKVVFRCVRVTPEDGGPTASFDAATGLAFRDLLDLRRMMTPADYTDRCRRQDALEVLRANCVVPGPGLWEAKRAPTDLLEALADVCRRGPAEPPRTQPEAQP